MSLIEANDVGLPILAPELDYVHDVCNPIETFDPKSSLSIARAVMRYVGKPKLAAKVLPAEDFWDNFFNIKNN
jgi:hypothetical protein